MPVCPECESSVGASDVVCMSCGTKLTSAGAEQKLSETVEGKPDTVNESARNQTAKTDDTVGEKIVSMQKTLVDSDNPLTGNDVRQPGPAPKVEPVYGGFSSDCPHFQCEWNKGSAIFIAETTSSISFRFTPVSRESRNAANFRLFLKFPYEASFKEQPLRFARLSAPREVYVNYKPKLANIGTAQAVDFYFSYEMNGQLMCFDQQITIDVYSQHTSKDKILDNLTISIGDIKQEGYGGDPNLALDILRNAQDSGGSLNDLLDSLKKTDLWTELILFSAIPLSGIGYQQRPKLTIPPAPSKKYSSLTLFTNSGRRIHLLNGEITFGRSRDADVIIRKLPGPDESPPWDRQRMIYENCRISGLHCKIGVDDDMAWVTDTSSNGSFIDNQRIGAKKQSIPVQSEIDLVLGGIAVNNNIVLKLRVYKTYLNDIERGSSSFDSVHDLTKNQVKDAISGIAVSRYDSIPESYIIINKWLPLTAVEVNTSKKWAIRYKHDSFALVEENEKWYWLEPETKLPPESGIAEVTTFKQYFLND